MEKKRSFLAFINLCAVSVLLAVCMCLLLFAGPSYAQSEAPFNQQPKTAAEAIEMLVQANRILANENILDHMGHVTVRNPENPKTFFMARAMAPELVTKNDIVELDLDGNVVTKTAMLPYSERVIHATIYKVRPDVNAVVHAHFIEALIFSVVNVPVKPLINEASMLSPQVPVYDEYDFTSPGNTGMLVTTKDQGDRLARVLGKSRAVLMRGHGCTVVGPDLPTMLVTVLALRNNMIVQMAAMQIGTPKFISEGEAKTNVASRSTPTMQATSAASRAWSSLLGRAKKAMPDLQ